MGMVGHDAASNDDGDVDDEWAKRGPNGGQMGGQQITRLCVRAPAE